MGLTVHGYEIPEATLRLQACTSYLHVKAEIWQNQKVLVGLFTPLSTFPTRTLPTYDDDTRCSPAAQSWSIDDRLLLARPRTHPNAAALVSHRGEPLVTYSVMSERSRCFAAALLELGTLSTERRLCGLIFERSVEMVVAIFGTLYAGGT